MRHENFDIEVLKQTLQGSCEMLDSTISQIYPNMDEDDLTEDELGDIGQDIFRCDSCGWWCDISENIEAEGEMICNDCGEE